MDYIHHVVFSDLFTFLSQSNGRTSGKEAFILLSPNKSLSVQVEGKGSTSFGGAKLYYVDEISKSFIWVKKNWLGYRVITDGTGP
ncbi:hypothetical protein [Paenibacillus allorhizoplanae]|uniref:hypothetical protein n=1 Tax=Paenibacillus allorhizoplanae TaxID=2905648 RepID=UPI001F23B934|nr:hypothetical protein [Paenibacillus allorhizoplanae]